MNPAAPPLNTALIALAIMTIPHAAGNNLNSKLASIPGKPG